VRLAQQLIEENKRLKGGTDQANSLLLAEAKKTAEHELAAARRAYKEAYEAGDPDRVVDAQEKLTEAKLKAERLASMRPRPQPALQAPETVVQTQQAAPVARDERAAKWKEENSWFGSDDEMTAFALGLHQKLVKSGMNPTSDEYYESINSRMRKVFPEQFGEADLEDEQPKAKPQARSNVVAPATRSTAPKKIVLTQSQVSIAKRLGVSLEDYAKQVALEMRKQNG
jgi:Pyruvate/2-oxoacid:ferredoxin oxidoreductase gamma subunit